MSFWRREVIDFALDHETRRQIEEQMVWIGREPANARPYFHLAQLYRMSGRFEEALGLLLEAVRLDEKFADAHVALAEMYAVRGDSGAALRHAESAARHGHPRALDLLRRYEAGV